MKLFDRVTWSHDDAIQSLSHVTGLFSWMQMAATFFNYSTTDVQFQSLKASST